MNAVVRDITKELRTRLEAVYGTRLSRFLVYGSQARGDAVSGSDIDVLVVLDGPVDPGKEIARTSHLVSDICLRHDTVVSCLFMDEDRYLQTEGPLLRNIHREGVLV